MAVQDQLKRATSQQDIPFSVVPDSYMQELTGKAGPGNYQYGGGPSVYAPFAPGTKTLASNQFEEEKRAQAESEKLAWQKFEEDKRAQRVAEALAASRASGSGGGGGTPTKTELLDAIREGAVNYAKNLVAGKAFTVNRGLQKGEVGQETGWDPNAAARATITKLQEDMGNYGLSLTNANYTDIIKSVYNSLGLQVPTAKSSTSSNATTTDDLRAKLLGQ